METDEKAKKSKVFDTFILSLNGVRGTAKPLGEMTAISMWALCSAVPDQWTIPINFEYLFICLFDRRWRRRSISCEMITDFVSQIQSSESLWRRGIDIYFIDEMTMADRFDFAVLQHLWLRTASDDVYLCMSRLDSTLDEIDADRWANNGFWELRDWPKSIKIRRARKLQALRPLTHSVRHAQQVIRHFVVDFYYQIAIAIDEHGISEHNSVGARVQWILWLIATVWNMTTETVRESTLAIRLATPQRYVTSWRTSLPCVHCTLHTRATFETSHSSRINIISWRLMHPMPSPSIDIWSWMSPTRRTVQAKWTGVRPPWCTHTTRWIWNLRNASSD